MQNEKNYFMLVQEIGFPISYEIEASVEKIEYIGRSYRKTDGFHTANGFNEILDREGIKYRQLFGENKGIAYRVIDVQTFGEKLKNSEPLIF